MPIWIGNKNLPITIRAPFTWPSDHAQRLQVRFPGLDVIDEQGEVVAAVGRMDHLLTSTDQVKFLVSAKSKPGAGKIERRALHRLQLQNVMIKRTAAFDVGDVKGHVIQLKLFHLFGDRLSLPRL